MPFSGSGYSNSFDPSIADISTVNPAALNEFEHMMVGSAYQFGTRLYSEALDQFDYYRTKPFLPQSVGLIIPFKAGTTTAGFFRNYNLGSDYGRIRRTVIDADGNGFVDWTESTVFRETTVDKYSIAAAVPFLANRFALGLRLDYFYLHCLMSERDLVVLTETGWPVEPLHGEENMSRMGLEFGLVSRFSRGSLGIYYEYGTDFEGKDITGSLPAQLSCELLLRMHRCLEVHTNLRIIFWSARTWQIDNISNQCEYAANLLYLYSNKTKAAIGLLFTDYAKEFYRNSYIEYDAIYFFLGARLGINRFELDVSIADSHLLSDDLFKQTIGRVGIGVRF